MSQATYNLKNQSFISRMLDSLDIFGQLPNLRVLKKERVSSKIGFLLTLALITFILVYLTNEFLQMIQQSQPQMIVSEELIFDTQAFPLQNDNFTLVVSISDWQNEQIVGLHKYFTLEIKSCVRTRTETEQYGNVTVNNTCISIPFETCNTSHFSTELQYNFFKKLRLGSHQCMNRDFLKNSPPVLKGQFNSNEFHYLILYLRICKNSTNTQTCAPIEEIKSKLSSAQYNIYSSDYLLQLARSGQPFQQIITPYYSTFSSSSSKQILQYFEIIDTVTDNGLLIEELDNSVNLKQAKYEEFSQLYNNNFLIQHYIAITQIKTKYFRSYIKIQTILAKIGGIWQFLITIITILLKPIFVDLMIMKVSNKLFRFNFKNELKENQISQEKLPDTYFQIIQTLFGCKQREKQLFLKAKYELSKKLDIVKIIQQLQMIECIHSLMFNDQERCLVKLLSKPTITNEQKVEDICLDSKFNLDSQNLQSRQSFVLSKKQTLSQKQNLSRSLGTNYQGQQQQQELIKNSYLQLKQTIEKDGSNIKKNTSNFDQKLLELFEKNYQKFVVSWFSPKSFTHRVQMSEYDDILEPIPRLPQ